LCYHDYVSASPQSQPAFSLRPATTPDLPLILSSWKRDLIPRLPIPRHDAYRLLNSVCDRLVLIHPATIVTLPESPTTILAWSLHTETTAIYDWCKPSFQEFGLLALLRQHHPRAVFNPYEYLV
jgi:hypothetical protein